MSVFVTSQKKKSSLSTESPGGHVPQASVQLFKTGFFFSAKPKHRFETGVACEAACFEIGATPVFL